MAPRARTRAAGQASAPAWTRVDGPGYVHWIDAPLARAWIDRAVAASTDARARDASAGFAAAQQALVRELRDALSGYYRALDLPPGSDPVYRAAFREAYAADPIDAARTGGWVSGRIGHLPFAAGDLYTATGHTAPGDPANVLSAVRAALSPSTGEPIGRCLSWAGGGLDGDCPFEPGRLYTGRVVDASQACAADDDWRCTGWNDAPGQPLRLAPALIESWRWLGSIARDLAARDPAQVVADAVADAMAAHRPASITGSATAPTHSVGIPDGFARPSESRTVTANPGVVIPGLVAPDTCDREGRAARLLTALRGFPIGADEAAAWNRANPGCPLGPSPVASNCPTPPVFRSAADAGAWNENLPAGCTPGVYVPPAVSAAPGGVPAWAWWVGGLGALGFAGWMLTNAKGRRA